MGTIILAGCFGLLVAIITALGANNLSLRLELRRERLRREGTEAMLREVEAEKEKRTALIREQTARFAEVLCRCEGMHV